MTLLIPRGQPVGRRALMSRRALLLLLLATAVSMPASDWLVSRFREPAWGPLVGEHLHSVALLSGRTFVSGHDATGYSDHPGDWKVISSLDQVHANAWAGTTDAIIVASDTGLSTSTDGGRTFTQAEVLPELAEVRALGAAGSMVYVATANGEVLASTDSGRTFERRNENQLFGLNGTISVDAQQPDRAIATDVDENLVETTDGGNTWTSIGSPIKALSAACNPMDSDEVVAVTSDEVFLSADRGQTWTSLRAPEQIRAVTYTDDGQLILASDADGRAVTFERTTNGWQVIV